MTTRTERDRALYAAIGQMIRAARLDCGLSQAALARDLGIFPQALNRAEAGRQRLTVTSLYRLADALRVTPADLLPPIGGAP